MTEPEITPDMRASARAHPNSWLYLIDPSFAAEDDVPPWGVVGAYAVDERGEIEAGFHRNPGYRPPRPAPGEPAAATELERLLELVKAGRRDQAELLPAVRDARLLLYAASAEDTTVVGFPDPGGKVMVPACTSVATVPAAWPGWREITGRDLVPLLAGHPLVINPNGPVTALIPAEHLAGR